MAVSSGQIVGTASAQRVTSEFLAAHSNGYDAVTDHNRFTQSHAEDGEVYQLIGVGVQPDFRGQRLGRLLVDHQIERARGTAGIQRIVGFTRPAHFARHADISMSDYVHLRNEKGVWLDVVLAFHLEAGAKIVSIHPEFRPQDVDSRGYGILIEYPIKPG